MKNTREFPAEKVKRPRHKKKQFDSESNDLATLDPEQQFRVQCASTLVDTALQSVEHRFEQLQEHCGYFSILYDIHNLLTDCYSTEVTAEDMLSEYRVLSTLLLKEYSTLTTNQVLQQVMRVHKETMPHLAKLAAAIAVILVSTADIYFTAV
ncbi:UNVERIFIED_CONTAM: hypothetical protein FKN15_049268 [Acipenser sinensis]